MIDCCVSNLCMQTLCFFELKPLSTLPRRDPKSYNTMALTREQWLEILEVFAEQRACVSCYAFYFRDFLERTGVSKKTRKYIRLNPAISHCTTSRNDMIALLATSKDCRCDEDEAETQ